MGSHWKDCPGLGCNLRCIYTRITLAPGGEHTAEGQEREEEAEVTYLCGCGGARGMRLGDGAEVAGPGEHGGGRASGTVSSVGRVGTLQ